MRTEVSSYGTCHRGKLRYTLKDKGPAVITTFEDQTMTRLWVQVAENHVELWDLVSRRLMKRLATPGPFAYFGVDILGVPAKDKKTIHIHMMTSISFR